MQPITLFLALFPLALATQPPTHPTNTIMHTPEPYPAIVYEVPGRPTPKSWEIEAYNETLHADGHPHHPDISKRQVAGVYVCDRSGWAGHCTWTVASGGACHSTSFNMLLGSAGPDRGLGCHFWPGTQCWFGDVTPSKVTYPGWSNWMTAENLMPYSSEGLQSYRCWWL